MSFYMLTDMATDRPHFWWNGRRWTKTVRGGCNTHRNVGTDGRKAWGLFNKLPSGFVLMKWFKKGGHRYLQEWWK